MRFATIPQIGERAQTVEDVLQSLLPGLLHGPSLMHPDM